MSVFRLLSILLFICGMCVHAPAQEYFAFARRYGIEEGLPHRQVNRLLQDRRGFIWAATSGGVARFDGMRFEVFNSTESGLDGDIAGWIFEDPQGYIWVSVNGAASRLNILDPVSGKVTRYGTFFKGDTADIDPICWVYTPLALTGGDVIVAPYAKEYLLRYRYGKGWSRLPLPGCTFFAPIRATQRNTFWGIFAKNDKENTLVEIDAEGRFLREIKAAPGSNWHLKKGENSYPDGFNNMAVAPGCKPVFSKFDGKDSLTPVPFIAKNWFVPQYTSLKNDQVMVQFPHILEKSGRVLLDLSQKFPEIDPLQYRDYLRDRNGNIWFATTFGLIVVELRKNHFKRLLYDENAPGGRGLACRGLLETNGLLTVNVETNGKGRYLIDVQTGAARRIPGNHAMGIARSSDGNIWTEMKTGDFAWWRIELQKTTPDGRPAGNYFVQKQEAGYIWAILEENPRRILLGKTGGVMVFDPVENTLTPLKSPEFPEFDKAVVSWLQKDRSGKIWACTANGLYRLNPGGGIAERFWKDGTGEHYLPYDNIYHLYEDAEGVFWLGTGGGGLIRWDRRAAPDKRLETVFRKNGLLNGVIYAVYEDRHDHLWMPTDYGIVQLDKKTLQVRRTWLAGDGLAHNEFNRISHCRGADGTLYFGGLNGVTAFQPDDFYANTSADNKRIPLVVSSFGVLDAQSGRLKLRTPDLLSSGGITIRPDDRYIQIEFALLDYIAPEKAFYSWKIDNVTEEWESLNEPVLRLSNLPYGTLHLRIRARAADGSLAANDLDIQLRVLAPVYLRWWFLSLMTLLLIVGIWVWLRWRTFEHRREQERLETEVEKQTATIRRQTEELKKLDEAKSRFFANVSHELRTPLTLILGPLGTLLKRKDFDAGAASQTRVAYEHGKQLLRFVNEILDLSKLEAGKMEVRDSAVALYPFLSRTVGAFESHANRLGIDFSLDYRLNKRMQVLLDEDKVTKVLNNLLSNAFKFTPPHAGGYVTVRVDATAGRLRFCVQDTGRGIHPGDRMRVFERFYQSAQPGAPVEGGTGIGLALCRELAQVMGGSIHLESEPGKGSLFIFEIPRKEMPGIAPATAGRQPAGDHDDSLPSLASREEAPTSTEFTVLTVEDNDSLRDYLKYILSGSYTVLTAEHGQAALDLLSAATTMPDLIISDVMMPVLDGFQLLKTLKNDDRWRHIPVVMLTARADLDDKLYALRTGVDDYLIKPFEEDELLARVDNLLENYRNRRPTPRSNRTNDDVTEHIPAPSFSADDLTWLENFEKLVEKNLGEFHLTAEMLAGEMAMSRAPFFRQLKRLTGLTPAQYLEECRFKKARMLLETRQVSSVKALSYTVGFRQVKHFSRNYKKRFGKLPSEVID